MTSTIYDEIDRITGALSDAWDAVEAKGGTVPQDTHIDNLAAAIAGIPAGGTTPTGTIAINTNGTHDVTNYASANVNVPGIDTTESTSPITAGDVKSGKIGFVNGQKVTGSMADVTANIRISSRDDNITIPAGYHAGTSNVRLASAARSSLIPENLKSGITILGQTGTFSGPTVMKHGTYTPTTRITSSNASSYRIDTGVTNPKLVLFALNSYNSNYINKDTSWNQLVDCYWIDDAWRVASDVQYAKGTFLNKSGTVRISTNGMCWMSVSGTSYIEFYTTGSDYCVPTTTFRWVAMA